MISRDVHIRLAASVVGCFAVLASLVACSDDSSGSLDTTDTSLDSPGATTTGAPASTTTSIAATTTTEAPVVFTLRNDGIGPFFYGADPDTVVAALVAQFGAAISDISTDYLEPTGGGYFYNADQTVNFLFKFGRETCWGLGLCVSFGGVDSSSATFVGWRYQDDPGSTLSTDAGVTLGSRLSDHPEIPAPLTCFSGSGPGGAALYDGFSWIVGDTVIGGPPSLFAIFRSDGAPFDQISDDSGAVTPILPPADVTIVRRLRAGEVPSDTATYCP